MSDDAPERRLAELEARVREDLRRTAHPTKPWMPARHAAGGAYLYDVVIAGAGQGGLAVAHALKRDRIDNILIIDRARYGEEGVWVQYARMPHLRSPKDFTGPDLNCASLTYQSWHEASLGAASWEALNRIPKEHWNAYLLWYRRVLQLPVRNEVELMGVRPLGEPDRGLALDVRTPAGHETLLARKLVLATGQDGTGRWWMPPFIEALPETFRATTGDPIDFARMKGKVVAVLGQGASAADNAATALEAGAAEVHMFVRRTELQRLQPFLWLTFAGFLRHLGEMPDAWRWRFMNRILTLRESIPQDTYERMKRHANYTIHRGAGWTSARVAGERVVIETAKGPFTADFLICGTGIDIDFTRRPELAPFADKIATWGDRYQPPEDERNERLARYPYHGPDCAFLEKVPGSAPFLADIHDFTIGTTMSFGPFGCSINAMTIAAPKVAAGVTRGLFAGDIEHHWRSLEAFDGAVLDPRPEDRD